MQKTDPWHYPRTELAAQIIGLFDSGLSSSFIFFAPRRMGKTEFLRKDIQPIAEEKGWNVFYFSFLDASDKPSIKFKRALEEFIKHRGVMSKVKNAVKKVAKVAAGVGKVKAELEFSKENPAEQLDVKELLGILSKSKKTLLLMDEVQALASSKKNDIFIASFRTALDMYKDNLKVIFTGSSQAGLRKMFSEAKAPFFHFGQNLSFPELNKEFTDHLSTVFKKISSKDINKENLWEIFLEMNKVPLLARSLVERMALNPNLSLDEAKHELITEVFGNREFEEKWKALSEIEQLLLLKIANKNEHIFSLETRNQLALTLNQAEIPAHTLQAAIKKLIRKGIIGKAADRTGYFIDDPNFKNWLMQKVSEDVA